ncbi:Unknown protein, partial [Striga hermonthica]
LIMMVDRLMEYMYGMLSIIKILQVHILCPISKPMKFETYSLQDTSSVNKSRGDICRQSNFKPIKWRQQPTIWMARPTCGAMAHERIPQPTASYYLDDFERELHTRFGTSDYHNYDEALTRIRQTCNLRDYLKEFERLACRVRGWPETALVGAFISGLKYDLAAEVRLERPESMHTATEVAQRREDHLAATRRGRADNRFTNTHCVRPSQSTAGTRPAINARPPGPVVKQLTPEEIKHQREKGLCFKCEEKFMPGHRCKQAFVIEITNSDEEDTEVEEGPEHEDKIEVLEEEAEISMHAMAGIRGPRPMRLPAWVKDRRVVVLVDNGSSHNFIKADLSQKLKLPTTKIEPFEVRVANGERLRCTESFRGALIKFQGVTVEADLYALPLVGPDVVLGVQWLEGLGKVTTDYRTGIMEFRSGGKRFTLKAGEEK